MFARCSCINLFKQKYNISTSSTILKTHYDALGITPKATQTDIKAAYYKLSMVYHPDKNKGSDIASKKFQDISAAYEVLGNFKLRRLYDKGILHTAGGQYAQEEPDIVRDDDPEAGFYRSRDSRRTAPTPSGRTPIYDFDEWSKAHYGSTFERAHRGREKYKQKLSKTERDKIDIKTEVVLGTLWGIVFLFVLHSYIMRTSYDEVSQNDSKKPK